MTNTPEIADTIRRRSDPRRERFFVLPVADDGSTRIFQLAEGDGIHVPVDIPKVFRITKGCGCRRFIIAHNHPDSPFPIASDADIRTSKKVYEIAKRMGFEFLDHIIVTETRYMSFREDGILAAYEPYRESRLNGLEIID